MLISNVSSPIIILYIPMQTLLNSYNQKSINSLQIATQCHVWVNDRAIQIYLITLFFGCIFIKLKLCFKLWINKFMILHTLVAFNFLTFFSLFQATNIVAAPTIFENWQPNKGFNTNIAIPLLFWSDWKYNTVVIFLFFN